MADTNAVREITAKLETGVKELFESDKYAAYLQTMSRFHRYSTRNTLLIHLQMPGATHVAGYNAWSSKFKRQVRKGERGIKIFAPTPFVVKEELEKLDPVTNQPIIGEDGQPVTEEYIKMQSARFKIVSVFDVSQTVGEPLPVLAETLTGDVARYELFMDALRAASPLPIAFEPMDAEQDGVCRFGDTIALREGMSEIQTVCAAIHEMTHAKLHDRETLRLADPNAKPKDRRTEEVEAESVSYAVCQYYGIETGANSFGYLAEWSRGRELKELNASLDTIRKTAAELIDGIDGHYRALAKERGIDISADVSVNEQDISAPEVLPAEPAALSPDLPANQIYAKYANIVAERAAQYAVSSGTLLREDETEARRGTDQIVNRVVDDLLLEAGEHYPLYTQYMDNPDFKARLEDYVFIKAYLEPKNTARETPAQSESTPEPAVHPLIAEYARNAEVSDPTRVGYVRLRMPVFIDGNYNREGKQIFVGTEERAGKYEIFSRTENDTQKYYFLTASGRIDRTSEYFRDVWDEEQRKWVNHLPTEAELDAVLPQIAERFELDMADPAKWAKYQHAAVVNRLDECDAHNAPVRKLREEESKRREAEAERERQEEKRQKQDKFDARIDEIAKAIDSGKTITVGYDEYAFDGKNPVLDLFKLYGVDLPLRTQGWVNTGLAEITDGSYRYYKSKHKGDSTAFSKHLKKLRDAIRATPIEQKRQAGQPAINTEVKNTLENILYEKFADLFPDFASGKYSYMRLESKGFEPLSLEWIFGDRVSVMHTYELNGDLCYDPMMEFRFNNIGKTMEASMFQQSIPPLYQYFDEDGVGTSVDGNGNTRIIRNLQSELNDFASQWLDNIAEQGYMPVKANLVIGEDDEVQVTFDADGNPIMPEPDQQEIQIGDILLIQDKKWLVEKIDGDFSLSLKNLNPNDIQSNQMFMGRWKQRLEEAGYSILTKQELGQPAPQKEYDLGYGFLGNGITVWNRAEEKDGDYATVAHIETDRTVKIYDKDMPDDVQKSIEAVAQSPETWAFDFKPLPDMPVAEPEKPKLTELDMSLPDPLTSAADRNDYGYTYDGMLPLSNLRAVELFDTDHCIYLLYPDNTEGMAFDRDEIRNHDGLCGIERDDWERSPVRAAQLAVAANSDATRESELLHGTTHDGMFGIYQIPAGIDEARDFRFAPMRELEAHGLSVDRANYELVYTAPLPIRDTLTNLNKIYADFNDDNRPAEYAGRSVSVSDVIVLQWRGEVSAHFVDSIGFKELPVFTGNEKQPESEMSEAERFENSPIVDFTVSSPPFPNVAELEADVKAGKTISLMDLSKAVNAERKQAPAPKGKSSLLEKLERGKQRAAQQGQTDAQKKNGLEV